MCQANAIIGSHIDCSSFTIVVYTFVKFLIHKSDIIFFKYDFFLVYTFIVGIFIYYSPSKKAVGKEILWACSKTLQMVGLCFC